MSHESRPPDRKGAAWTGPPGTRVIGSPSGSGAWRRNRFVAEELALGLRPRRGSGLRRRGGNALWLAQRGWRVTGSISPRRRWTRRKRRPGRGGGRMGGRRPDRVSPPSRAGTNLALIAYLHVAGARPAQTVATPGPAAAALASGGLACCSVPSGQRRDRKPGPTGSADRRIRRSSTPRRPWRRSLGLVAVEGARCGGGAGRGWRAGWGGRRAAGERGGAAGDDTLVVADGE